MSAAFTSARRRRGDALAFALALATFAALALLFPFDVFVRARAPAAEPARAHFAFVTLSPSEESRIVAAARSAWRVSAVESGRVHIDLYGAALPPADAVRASDATAADEGLAAAAQPLARLPADEGGLLPPSRAARPPRPLGAPSDETRKPAFSRDELLKTTLLQ